MDVTDSGAWLAGQRSSNVIWRNPLGQGNDPDKHRVARYSTANSDISHGGRFTSGRSAWFGHGPCIFGLDAISGSCHCLLTTFGIATEDRSATHRNVVRN